MMICMKSRVYRDLTPLKLNQVTIDDIDTLRSGMYAQGRKNKTQYVDLQQVAVASNQQGGSGSVPGTSVIASVANIYDNKSTLYAPTIGTWILEAVEFTVTGGTGSYTNEIYLEQANGATLRVIQSNEKVFLPKIEVDLNVVIQARSFGGGGPPLTSLARCYLMRRR